MSEKILVLDSSALLAYLQDEDGAEEVEQALLAAQAAGSHHLIASVNWAEVLYVAPRQVRYGDVAAVLAAVDGLPIHMVDAGRELSIRAAGFKYDRRVGLADAYAAALATLLDAPLLTADPDFEALQGDGLQLQRIR